MQAFEHSNLEVAPEQIPVASNPKVYQPYDPPPPHSDYYSPTLQNAPPARDRTILGFRPATFFLSLALIFVILAAAIGGGVGGTIAVNNAKNSAKSQNNIISTVTITAANTALGASSTSTPSSTTTTTSGTSTTTTATATRVTVPTTGYIALDCPAIDNTNLRVTLSSTSLFTVTCGQDFSAGFGAKSLDIVAVTVYSIQDCAKACASYNHNWGSSICKAVRFDSDLGGVGVNFGTCWLKNGTGTILTSSSNLNAGMILQ